jgi:hypothetical protein
MDCSARNISFVQRVRIPILVIADEGGLDDPLTEYVVDPIYRVEGDDR